MRGDKGMWFTREHLLQIVNDGRVTSYSMDGAFSFAPTAREVATCALGLMDKLDAAHQKIEAGSEYRLVSEDEWQTLRDELAWHKAEAKRLESEGARLENEVYNLRWQYSHEDPNADEPECEAEWIEHAKVETVWRYDANGNLIYKGPPECACSRCREDGEDEAESVSFDFDKCHCEPLSGPSDFPKCGDSAGSGTPQRPHESLVWATFLAAVVNAYKMDKHGPVMTREALTEQADRMLDWWRSRWPEPEE